MRKIKGINNVLNHCSLLFVICSFLFVGCFNPLKPLEDREETVVTINLAVDNGSRAVCFSEDDSTYTVNDFDYFVTLTSTETGELKTADVTESGGTLSARAVIRAGSWKIDVTVKFSASAPPPTGDIYSVGSVTRNIQISETISVSMNRVVKVEFDSKGGTPSVAPQFVIDGGLVPRPASPTSPGEVLVGWYTDDVSFLNPWDFTSDRVSASPPAPGQYTIKLFAKWLQAVTVTFDSNGGSNVPEQQVPDGGLVPRPSPNPTKPGFSFVDWYTDAALTTLYNFVDPVDASVSAFTLYAKWDVAPTGDFYYVNNEADLRKVGTGLDGWNLDAHYILTTDITITGGDWTPIGTSDGYDTDESFTGVFDGNSHTITGLTINSTDDYQGLFGFICRENSWDPTPKIENVTLVNVNIIGGKYVGSIAGQIADGIIKNCSVTSGTVNGVENVGGIIGLLGWYATVQDCNTSILVTGTDTRIGGVVGSGAGIITGCSASGNITGLSSVGGIAGDSSEIVRDSNASGDITGDAWVGGLVGSNDGVIENCYATSTVNGIDNVGGLVGRNGGKVQNSYAKGNVFGSGENVGGIAGINWDEVKTSYSTSDVKGTKNVGGVVGYNSRRVSNSYATGAIIATVGSAGGVAGSVNWDTEIQYCYATGDITATDTASGVTTSNWGSTTKNTVALSKNITTSGVPAVRIVPDIAGGTLTNNYGRTGITLEDSGGPVGTTNDHTDIHGADVTDAQAITANWWKTTAWDNEAWDFTSIWNEPSGSTLPTLRNMPTAHTQNPQLQQ